MFDDQPLADPFAAALPLAMPMAVAVLGPDLALSLRRRELAVILLQDVTVLHRLRGIVPICAGCNKIRRDDRA